LAAVRGFSTTVSGRGARIEANERVAARNGRARVPLGPDRGALERLERRLWLAVYGVAAVVLAQLASSHFADPGGALSGDRRKGKNDGLEHKFHPRRPAGR
jgi:hypothetical protein